MSKDMDPLIERMTLQEKVSLTTGKDMWSTHQFEHLSIPSLVFADGPHGVRKTGNSTLGLVNPEPATCFPTASALGASWDRKLVSKVGEAIANECLALGVHVLLGPGINLKRLPIGGRNFEYYSEDPYLTAELATAFVEAVQSQGVGTSVKHFACNNQEYERMTMSADVDSRTLRELYCYAFERVVKEAQPWTIMTAYNRINGVSASENSFLLTEILREEWGFHGLVVSDWGAVYDKVMALKAGLDLEMPGNNGFTDKNVLHAVEDGLLEEDVLDQALKRIFSIMNKAKIKEREPTMDTLIDRHHRLARKAACESIVLLKNQEEILPLEKNRLCQIALIGRFAKEPRYQGAGSSKVKPTRLETVFEEIHKNIGEEAKLLYAPGYTLEEDDDVNQELIQEAVQKARDSEVALVFVGLPPKYESEGYDRKHLSIPPSHEILITKISQAQPNTVVVLLNGSPVEMPWVTHPKAILEGYLIGQGGGGAIADIIFGRVNPSGKLAETFPVRIEDNPGFLNYPGENNHLRYGEGLFIGYRYYEHKKIQPLFPFGFGLSYTSFQFKELSLDREELFDRDHLNITVDLENTGQIAGSEVIQVYVSCIDSQVTRVPKELKSFRKVFLQPGESRRVELTLPISQWAYWDTMQNEWHVEEGEYRVFVGNSSQHIFLSAVVKVVNSEKNLPLYTEMTPIKHFWQDPLAKRKLMSLLYYTPFVNKADTHEQQEFLNHMLKDLPVIKLLTYSGGILSEKDLNNLLLEINGKIKKGDKHKKRE